jgi:hypothetical protein
MDWLVEANVSEKRTVSIFRAEVRMQGIRGITQNSTKGSLKERANQNYIIIIVTAVKTSNVKSTAVYICYKSHTHTHTYIQP